MRIRLYKKESIEPKGHWVVYLRGEEWCTRNTEKEAQAVVNSYDGEGECWYEFQADESASEGTFTDTFRIQYVDEFDPEFSGKEVMVKGTGADRAAAKKDAINKFYDEHPDAEIHAVK